MNRKRVVAMVAAGSLAALGIAGTALAAGADDSAPRAQASSGTGTRTGLSVSAASAKEIAVRAAGGGVVESVEREVEHGRAVWDVDVLVGGVEHDIDVDAATGTVLRHRIDGRGRGGDDDARVTPGPSTSGSVDDRGRRNEAGDDRGRDSETGDDHGRTVEKGGDNGRGHGEDD